MIHSYLWVTGTFLRQIQICIARSEFVHAWRICFGLSGVLFVVVFSNKFILAKDAFGLLFLSYIVCSRGCWLCSTSLPGGHQVDGSPPAPSVLVRVHEH